MPRRFKAIMTEICTYSVDIEVPDDVEDLNRYIDDEAEEAFVQGYADFISCEERHVQYYKEVKDAA